jgi:NAD(P)H dehydrogenase (quinone)
MADTARIAVIYYSATGNVHGLAQAVAEGAEGAGAEVRLRHVEELASELLISQNQYWGRHRSQVADAPVATLDASSGPTASRSGRRRASAMSRRS